MKLSVEFGKQQAAQAVPVITGTALKSHVVLPKEAELLRRHAERIGRLPNGTHIKKRTYDSARNTIINQDFQVAITSANAEVFISAGLS